MNLFSVLSSLNIPFCHPPYTGDAESFLVYYLENDARSGWASGQAWQNETTVSIEVFSRGPYESIVADAMSLLRAAGCSVACIAEDYETETGYHHVTLDVSYWEPVGMYEDESNG